LGGSGLPFLAEGDRGFSSQEAWTTAAQA
jgi:hypothetical protein